jgi:hypothetical protein
MVSNIMTAQKLAIHRDFCGARPKLTTTELTSLERVTMEPAHPSAIQAVALGIAGARGAHVLQHVGKEHNYGEEHAVELDARGGVNRQKVVTPTADLAQHQSGIIGDLGAHVPPHAEEEHK